MKDSTQFKCSFCNCVLYVRQYGAAEIKCGCGAVYKKQLVMEVSLEKGPQ